MAGVKGRSGRRTKRNEEKRHEIIDKAWELIREKLHSASMDRFNVARDIVIKDITTRIEGKGFDTNIHTLISQIRQDFVSGDSKPSLELDNGDGLHEGRTRPSKPDKEIP